MRKALLVFLAVVLLVGCGADAVKFRLQPREGDELRYELDMEMTMKQMMMGTTMTTHQNQIVGFDQRILEVEDDGTISQEMEYTRMAMDMSMEGPDGNEVFSSHYDSEQPEDSDQQFKNLGKIVGVTTKMKVSPTGEILEISGWDEAVDKILADLPTETKAQFKDVFGEKAMMGWMSEINASYQSDPVSVGDTWMVEHELQKPFPMRLETDIKLAGINSDNYELHYQAQLSSPEEGGASFDFGPMPMTMDLSGTATGKIFLDRETHLVTGMESNHEYEGVLKMDMSEMENRPSRMPETMEIPVEITQKQKLGGKFL